MGNCRITAKWEDMGKIENSSEKQEKRPKRDTADASEMFLNREKQAKKVSDVQKKTVGGKWR